MSEELNVVDLPSESTTDQVIESPETDDESVQNDTETQQPLTKEQKKILELKAQKKSLTEQKYRERQEKQQLLAELEQLRAQHTPATEELDIDALVDKRVQERIEQDKQAQANASFNAACETVFDAGKKTYPDFAERIGSLKVLNIDLDTLDYIATSGVGEKILYELSDDLDEAERILKLSTLKRVEALIDLKRKVVSKPTQTKRTSNAPEPIPNIGGKTGKTIGNISEDYDAFDQWLTSGLKNSR